MRQFQNNLQTLCVVHNGKLLIKFCCFSCKRKDLVEFQERFSALRCHHCGGPIQNPASEAALAHSMPCLDCGKIQVKSNPLQRWALRTFPWHFYCMGNLALRDLLHPSIVKIDLGEGKIFSVAVLFRSDWTSLRGLRPLQKGHGGLRIWMFVRCIAGVAILLPN